MKEIYDFIKKCKVYYLATIDDNLPKVRPFHTFDIYDNHFYLQTEKTKDVFKQVIANPNVQLCALYGNLWLRITGTIKIDDSINAKRHMFDNNIDLKCKYDVNNKGIKLLYFDTGTITIYDNDTIIKELSF